MFMQKLEPAKLI